VSDITAEVSTTIEANPERVWAALTEPHLIEQYFMGARAESDWKVGRTITWSGTWKGQPYEDKGEILEVEPQRLLKYTHWSPMGGSEDRPENYHTVTYELAGADGHTTLTLKQDNNPTEEEARAMADNNWGPVLEGLKETAEA